MLVHIDNVPVLNKIGFCSSSWFVTHRYRQPFYSRWAARREICSSHPRLPHHSAVNLVGKTLCTTRSRDHLSHRSFPILTSAVLERDSATQQSRESVQVPGLLSAEPYGSLRLSKRFKDGFRHKTSDLAETYKRLTWQTRKTSNALQVQQVCVPCGRSALQRCTLVSSTDS